MPLRTHTQQMILIIFLEVITNTNYSWQGTRETGDREFIISLVYLRTAMRLFLTLLTLKPHS